MALSSLIYSVSDAQKGRTEVQLLFTRSDLRELQQYCSQIDLRRERGLIHEEIYLGRFFRRHLGENLSRQDIQAQVMHSDLALLQDERNYQFYRNGLRISSTEIAHQRYDIDYLEYRAEDHEELTILCDRNRLECFFQFLKAFSQGFWGDVFEFSETLSISTCIHDYTEDDLPLLRDVADAPTRRH